MKGATPVITYSEKVEEVLGDLYRYMAHAYQTEEDYVEDEEFERLCHAIIAVVRAEGAEQKKKQVFADSISAGKIWNGAAGWSDTLYRLVPASVLDPEVAP